MFKAWLRKQLSDLTDQGLLRMERTFSHEGAMISEDYDVQSKPGASKLVNFADNNYLGLASHSELVVEAKKALDQHGISTAASRLITGTHPLHRKLEKKIAAFKGAEDAITFTSGYQANITIIQTIADKTDLIYSDRLNHASLIDGIRLTGCRFFRYRHNDPAHLDQLLAKRPDTTGKTFIISDSVFSMDGDIARIHDLVALKEKYNAALMLDEAHATGVLGERGHGALEHLGVNPESIEIIMGTFSKAIGVFGAYAAGSKDLIAWLRTRGRGYIYTTAYPPMIAAVIIKSLDLVENGAGLRRHLQDNTEWLKKGLKKAGFDFSPSETQIIPIMVGDNGKAVQFQQDLEKRGFFVSAIRPPTVPPGTARLRLTVSSMHTRDEMGRLLEALIAAGKELKVIS